MYFGNAFSIPGVIVLLIIGLLTIAAMGVALSDTKAFAAKQGAHLEEAEKKNQELEEENQRLRKQNQSKQQQEQYNYCIVM